MALKLALIELWDHVRGSLFLHALVGSGFVALWEKGLAWPQRLFRALLGTMMAGYTAWALAVLINLHVAVASGIAFWGGFLAIKAAPVIEKSVLLMIEGVFAVLPEAARTWLRRPGGNG